MTPSATLPPPLAPGAPPMSPAAPVAPAAPAPIGTNPLVTIPLSDDDRKKWQGDIDRADKRRQVFEPSWEKNLKEYTPDPTNEKWGEEINPGVDFYQTEQKKALLFFDTPSVILMPEPDADPQTLPAIATQQTKLNRRLGRHGLDMKRVMDQVLFDIICPSGVGCMKIGMTRLTKDTPVNGPDGQPRTDGEGQPVTAPVPVYQKIFCERFSPKKVLIPVNFHSTEFDKAPWLGMKFTMSARMARREFQIPPDIELAAKQPNTQVFVLPGLKPDTDDDDEEVTGSYLCYKAAYYDDAVFHPEWLRELVFIDGLDDPVVHRDLPYQTFDPNTGEFTPDSMIGNPIHLITIRDLADSAYVPSDCTMTRPLVSELAAFRTQLIQLRDSSTSVRIANGDVITPEILSKVVRSPFGAILLVPGSAYNPNQQPITELAHPVYTRENFTAQDKIETDLTKVNTMGANQVGAQQETVRSATELTYVQRNANVRMQAERNRAIAGFLGAVAKIDALVKRYEKKPGEPPISGYTYDIKPDSGVHVDAAEARQFFTEIYNMLAKDPNVNRMALLKELLPLVHLDPTQIIVQPPPSGPPPPSTSVIVKGEDLSPLQPQYTNVLQVMNDVGMKLTATPITPNLMQNAALAAPIKPPKVPEHGGTPAGPDLVSKHTAENSGQIPNLGGQAGHP